MDSSDIRAAAAVLEAAVDQPAGPSAAARLRAFEDRVLGKDVARIDGHIERGYGSKYRDMTPDNRAKHDLLVALVDTEDRVNKATNELNAAIAAHDAAEAKATGL